MSGSSNTLLIDAGNSRIKWAVCDGQSLSHHGVAAYQTVYRYLGIESALNEVFNSTHFSFDRVLVGSVSSKTVEQAISKSVRAVFSLKPIFQSVDPSNLLVDIAYQDPSQLGVDRWLAMVGARFLYDSYVCVADCGTALTLDYLTVEGKHVGGVIVPGSHLMQQTLLQQTAKIRDAEQKFPSTIFATNTAAAVNTGCQFAMAALYDRFIDEARALGATDTLAIATGGGAESLIRYCQNDVVTVPDLVLLGLSVTGGVMKINCQNYRQSYRQNHDDAYGQVHNKGRGT